MFERFTERARQVVVLAQDEARQSGSTMIGEGHILLGLIREEEGLAAHVLASLHVEIEGARRTVLAAHSVIGPQRGEDENPEGQLPFTPRAQKALELSLREALSLGHNYIGTEHILLGLTRENGLAMTILTEGYGLSNEKVRNEVIRMLSGPKAPQIAKDPANRTPARHPFSAGQEQSLETVPLDLITTAITLGRQYPEQSTDAIIRAAKALHGKGA